VDEGLQVVEIFAGHAGMIRPGCARHLLQAKATSTSNACIPWDGGVGPVEGDAVRVARSRLLVCAVLRTRQDRGGVLPNPPEACLGPMALTPRNLSHPAFDSFPRAVGTAFCLGGCRPLVGTGSNVWVCRFQGLWFVE
jgi:hypothetical protein